MQIMTDMAGTHTLYIFNETEGVVENREFVVLSSEEREKKRREKEVEEEKKRKEVEDLQRMYAEMEAKKVSR